MLNGATLGLVPTFNSENDRRRKEYGEGVFWTCNIAGGIAALALTAAGAVFTEGGSLLSMTIGAVLGAGFGAMRQLCLNIDMYGFSGFQQWRIDGWAIAGDAVMGFYLGGIFLIPVVG